MKFSYRQRKYMPSCYDEKDIKRVRHSWKKGEEIFKEAGICGICGYDAFDDVHRIIPEVKGR